MRRVRWIPASFIGALSIAVAACDLVTPVSLSCTDIALPALVVEVVDAVSGAPLTGSTSLILEDGAFRDSVMSPEHYTGSQIATDNTYERPGSYDVRVRRSGYAVWERANVVVTADQCHVRTVRIEARLQPLP